MVPSFRNLASTVIGGESVKWGTDALSSVIFSRTSPRTRTKIRSPNLVWTAVPGPVPCGARTVSSVPQWLPGEAFAGLPHWTGRQHLGCCHRVSDGHGRLDIRRRALQRGRHDRGSISEQLLCAKRGLLYCKLWK